MLTLNTLFGRLRNRIPKPVMDAMNDEFLLEILYSETLPLYSTYYPKTSKTWKIRKSDAIPSTDSEGNQNPTMRYVVPLEDDKLPYMGIDTYHTYENQSSPYTGGFSSQSMLDSAYKMVTSNLNTPDIRTVMSFEYPNIIVIDTPSYIRLYDFVVTMKRIRKLEEIKAGYHEWFKDLFLADVKVAAFNRFFYQLEGGGTFGGVELKDLISDWKDAADDRDDLIEKFEEDFFKDPDRFDEMFNFTGVLPYR